MSNLSSPPPCELCPVVSGRSAAMKKVKGHPHKWCHVVCCLWIPETWFQDPHRMDVVVNLENVSKIRRSLTCSVCKQRNGACVQCNDISCSVSYHVTCAMNSKYEVSAEYVNEDNEAHFVSYCRKHTEEVKKSRLESNNSANETEATPTTHRKTRNSMKSDKDGHSYTFLAMTPRKIKLERIKTRFYTFVDLTSLYASIKAPSLVLDAIFEYWKLKRKSLSNQPLLSFASKDDHLNTQLEKWGANGMRNNTLFLTSTYIDLRRDMEKLRNLVHMIHRREKLKKSFFYNELFIFDTDLMKRELESTLINQSVDLIKKPLTHVESYARYNHGDFVIYGNRYYPRKSFRRSLCDENQNRLSSTDSESERFKQSNDLISSKNYSPDNRSLKRKLDTDSEMKQEPLPVEMQGKRLDLRDLVDKLLAASEFNERQEQESKSNLTEHQEDLNKQVQDYTSSNSVQSISKNNLKNGHEKHQISFYQLSSDCLSSMESKQRVTRKSQQLEVVAKTESSILAHLNEMRTSASKEKPAPPRAVEYQQENKVSEDISGKRKRVRPLKQSITKPDETSTEAHEKSIKSENHSAEKVPKVVQVSTSAKPSCEEFSPRKTRSNIAKPKPEKPVSIKTKRYSNKTAATSNETFKQRQKLRPVLKKKITHEMLSKIFDNFSGSDVHVQRTGLRTLRLGTKIVQKKNLPIKTSKK